MVVDRSGEIDVHINEELVRLGWARLSVDTVLSPLREAGKDMQLKSNMSKHSLALTYISFFFFH